MNRIPSALKHGAYSATAVLPGESQAEFEKLHQSLIAEISPSGALEDDIVMEIARLSWRKQNLETFHLAECARRARDAIIWNYDPERILRPSDEMENLSAVFDDPAELAKHIQDTEQQAHNAMRELHKGLGDSYELLELDKIASFNGLLYELDVKDRLDGCIDRCLKRLLYLRGLKSISAAPSSEIPKRLPGPELRERPRRAAG